MQTYWDHTEQERAAMSREDVGRFLDLELMRKGVLKVKQPELEPVPHVETPEETKYFAVQWKDSQYSYSLHDLAVAFTTAQDAEAFLKLNFVRVCSAYGVSKNYVEHLTGASIVEATALRHDDYLNCKARLDESQEAKNRNEKLQSEFKTAAKTMDDALADVWSNWSECRDAQATHQQVMDTWNEYRQLANGDEDTARKFLRKVFSDDDVEAAEKWFADASVPA